MRRLFSLFFLSLYTYDLSAPTTTYSSYYYYRFLPYSLFLVSSPGLKNVAKHPSPHPPLSW